MSQVSRRWIGRSALFLLTALGCVGCRSFQDSAEVPGTGQRLVVGHHDGVFSTSARIWVEENGEFTEVQVVAAPPAAESQEATQ